VTDELTVDVEHTGYPIGHRDYALRTVQLGTEAFAVDLDPHDPSRPTSYAATLPGPKLHAHSATADLIPLAVAGLVDDLEEAWTRMHDTVIPAKLADPASTGSDPDLKKLAAHMLGDRGQPAGRQGPGRAVQGRQVADQHQGHHTAGPLRLGPGRPDQHHDDPLRRRRRARRRRYRQAAARPRPEILDRERLAQRMTARVTHQGLRIDGEHVQACSARSAPPWPTPVNGSRTSGSRTPAVTSRSARWPRARRPTARHQDRTPLGGRERAVLPYAKAEGPLGDFVRARLDYQKAETALGLFLEPYALLVEHGDGRARPTVYTLSADTGRMSCVRPNLQQVPREGGFRACITADPGEVLISADFAGVEIRVAAALSSDPSLMAILRRP
jgi:hypothetical protein